MLKTVATFTEPWEAHLFSLLLRAEGLFSVVLFDQHVGVNYSIAWAIGGVQVAVAESELEQAREIGRRCRAGEFAAALEADVGLPERWHCGRCGSGNGRRSRTSSPILSLLAALVFGIAVPIRGYVYRCSQCGLTRAL